MEIAKNEWDLIGNTATSTKVIKHAPGRDRYLPQHVPGRDQTRRRSQTSPCQRSKT